MTNAPTEGTASGGGTAPNTPMDLASPQDAAEAYAALGWRVVPIGPRTKHPRLDNWAKAATDDLDTIRSWWTGLYRGHGVGIATGHQSGIWVLDIDVADGKAGAETLAAMNAEHGKLPETVTAITGSGGLHLLFNTHPDHPITNGSSRNLGPGLDIRGEGGQIVVAPTIHPNGRPYRWHPNRHPWALPVADAPTSLYQLIETQPTDNSSVALHLPPERPTTTGDTTPADWYRQHTTWPELLTQAGWTQHHTQGEDTYWTRPGKHRRDGHSAVQHGTDGPLVIFTTELNPTLEALGRRTTDGSGVSVTKFSFYAATRHAGDTAAAARTIRTLMPTTSAAGLDGAVTGLLNNPVATAATDPAEPAGGPIDVAHWWDNPQPPKRADALIRTDGQGLLYTTELNWIHGDSGSGKTWVLLYAAAQLLQTATPILWIHYEDPTPNTIISRLRTLGTNRQDVIDGFHYWDPQGEPLDTGRILTYCHNNGIEFVALDSIGEALNAQGLDEDKDPQVGPWLTNGPRAIVNEGIGFCGVDHGTKAGERPLHPSGSKRKRAAITGAGLLIESVLAPTQTTAGELRIVCAKDRQGNHAQGAEIGRLHLTPNLATGHLDIRLNGPDHALTAPLVDPAAAQRSKLERAALECLRTAAGPVTLSTVRASMPEAAKADKIAALEQLMSLGEVVEVTGPKVRGQSVRYFQTSETTAVHLAPSIQHETSEF